ncbi:MAG: hypothetical protein LBH69_01990 [Methanomassiliicoccaceae archaeon]|jgi:hypothetical protein|nr:hypothetical protein [Methanomassiliicoccaceae archaeon]
MDRDSRSTMLTMVVAMIIFVPLAYLCLHLLGDSMFLFSEDPHVLWILFLLSFFAWIFIHTFLHELGHLIFGKLSGYEFLGISVSGWWLLRGPDCKLRIVHAPMKGAGGATIMVPRDGYKDDTPYAMFILGGVLMNLLTATALFLLIVLDVWPSMNFFIGMVAILGICMAAVSLVPMTYGSLANDAALLRLFRRDEASKHCMYFSQRMYLAYLNGTDLANYSEPPPADLPAGNLLAEAVRVNLIEIEIRRGRYDIAERQTHELLNDMREESMVRRQAKMHLLLIYAINGAGKETVDAVYDPDMKKFMHSFAVFDLEAILFLVAYEKRFDAGDVNTDKLVKRFDALLKKTRIDTAFERSVMDSLLSERREGGSEN